MSRMTLFALLVFSLLSGPVQAQRGGAGSRGAAGRPFGGRSFSSRSFATAGFRRNGWRNGNFGYFGLFDFDDYGEPLQYGQTEFDGPTNGPMPLPPMARRAPEPPLPKGELIEVPGAENAAAAKVLPPTIFVLTNGERLESRRFVLTASVLSVRVGREQRNIPVQNLNIDATVATNRERGVDLRIPDDRSEVSLSF